MKLYVVVGITGEYSDCTRWTVCAYKRKEKAEKHADDAMLWAKHIKSELDKKHKKYWDISNGDMTNPLDPNFLMQHTGTDYYIEETELMDE